MATKYSTYKKYSLFIDKKTGNDKWRETLESPEYDGKRISKLADKLAALIANDNIPELIHLLRNSLVKNLHSMHNPILYYVCFGTKITIHRLNRLFVLSLHHIFQTNKLKIHEKRKIFKELQLSFGRTALVLSGGASFGFYHPGILKLLHEHNLAPKIISGTSAGSIIAGIYGSILPSEREAVNL